jgi:hypothetical protein
MKLFTNNLKALYKIVPPFATYVGGNRAGATVEQVNEVVTQINKSAPYSLFSFEVKQTGVANPIIQYSRGTANCPCICPGTASQCVQALTVGSGSCTSCGSSSVDNTSFAYMGVGVYKFVFTDLMLELLQKYGHYSVNVETPNNPKVSFAIVKSGVANEFLLKTALFAAGDFTLTDGLLDGTIVEIKIWTNEDQIGWIS